MTPDYINREWTEELFAAMVVAYGKSVTGKDLTPQRTKHRRVSNDEWFGRHGVKVTVH